MPVKNSGKEGRVPCDLNRMGRKGKVKWAMFPNGSSFRKNPALASLGVLGLAGLGQFFLAQADKPFTLWIGLGFYGLSLALLWKILPPSIPAPSSPIAVSPRVEIPAFLLLAALAFFFRAYGANRFPDGVFADRAEVALGALRILNEHWRPFTDALSLHVPEVCVYYLAALWMKFFGPAPQVFSYFDAALSTLGALGFYWVFRLWAGPATALPALFFLAVMRWNFAFGHQVYYQCQTVLFMAPALGLLFYALLKNRWPFAALGGLVAGLGLYAYQSFKAFPILLLLILAFEWARDPKGLRQKALPWAAFGLTFLLTAAPLASWMLQNGEIGRRESEVSVVTEIRDQQSLTPVWRNLRDAAFMFNRQGDINHQSNYASRRMLDDVTGAIFLLGFFHALARFKERKYFYALAGLYAMSLPSLLSINGGHAGRMLGATPFTALLCGLLWADGGRQARVVFQGQRGLQRGAWVLAACLLGLSAFLNFHAYFVEQASDPYCRNDFSWPESTAGRLIASADDKSEFFLTSSLYGHPTVKFLTYPRWGHLHALDLSDPPKPPDFPPGTSFCFLEDEFKAGALAYLAQAYPGGKTDAFVNPLGAETLYDVRVPATALSALSPGAPRVERGLKGEYRLSGNAEEKPFLERWDPVVNFTFRDLPMTSHPLDVHWTGRLRAPQSGVYEFQVATLGADRAGLAIDGKDAAGFVSSPAARMVLKAGWHSLDLKFHKGLLPIATVGLLWKRPGEAKFEFIPNGALGKVPPGMGRSTDEASPARGIR